MSNDDLSAADRGPERNNLLGLRWTESPQRIQWGLGMMEALVALGKDHTLRLFAEAEALHLVEPALISTAVAAERGRIASLIATHTGLTLGTLEYLETMRQGPNVELNGAARPGPGGTAVGASAPTQSYTSQGRNE